MARPRGDSAAAAKRSKPQQRKTDSGDKPKASIEVREKRVSRGSASRSPEKRSHNKSSGTSQTSSNVLSVDSLAKLNAENEKHTPKERYEERQQKEKVVTGRIVKERGRNKKKRRVVSGAVLEEGRGERAKGRRGGYMPTEGQRRRFGRRFWIVVGVIILLLIILIPVGVLVVGKHNGNGGSTKGSAAPPSNANLNSISPNDIPVS